MLVDTFDKVHKKSPNYVLKIYGKVDCESEIKEYIVKKGLSSSIKMEGFRKKYIFRNIGCIRFFILLRL